MNKKLKLFLIGIGLKATITLAFTMGGFASSNNIALSGLMESDIPLEASSLIPQECSYMQITNLVTKLDETAGAYLGTPGNDLIIGAPGNDMVMAGDGDDCIVTGGGADAVMGEGGDDVILAGEGINYIDGGDGIDTCYSGGDLSETIINCEQ
ncbi:MAG: hypothetical protein CVU41_16080 [Chloroflexi bacterium HGW-Chloroflexi-3]|nr:MAG: hypothetical protein CVU41_16080 [Chloroflexi bacterium HGW-Chloroflexi-3]